MTLPRELAGAVTGIGSLPFTSVAEAVRAVVERCPEVPFWPQLPRLSAREAAVGQGLGTLIELVEPRVEGGYGYRVKPGRIDAVVDALHASAGELTPENAAGFFAFEQAARRGEFARALAVKGQIEGPITLATYLFHGDRAFVEEPALFAAVTFHVAQMVRWQIARLRESGRPVLMFLDEPALCLNALSEDRQLRALSALLDDCRAQGAFAGLHCCAAQPFARMCAARPDVLSFDAHFGLEEFFAHPGARAYVEGGGWVAYGLIPNSEPPRAPAIFSRWLAAAAMAGEPEMLAQRAMVTATCGLGLLEPAAVEQSFEAARTVGCLIRQLSGG